MNNPELSAHLAQPVRVRRISIFSDMGLPPCVHTNETPNVNARGVLRAPHRCAARFSLTYAGHCVTFVHVPSNGRCCTEAGPQARAA